MLSPYDWQEGIGHRSQYVESRLAGGSPVVGASFDEAVVFLTYRKQARKLFEIYDELMMGAIGQQSDIESMRQAAVDFAHQEGFNRSERDVTIQRVVNALSSPIKRAFADFSMVPVVARALFAQVCPAPSQDSFVMLDYDGDFHARHGYAYVAPSMESAEILERRLGELKREKVSLEKGVQALKEIWLAGFRSEEVASPEEVTGDLHVEVAKLLRQPKGQSRFVYETAYVD
jgi:proteasome alpha subunit